MADVAIPIPFSWYARLTRDRAVVRPAAMRSCTELNSSADRMWDALSSVDGFTLCGTADKFRERAKRYDFGAAGVMELAYMPALGAGARKSMRVRVPPPALRFIQVSCCFPHLSLTSKSTPLRGAIPCNCTGTVSGRCRGDTDSGSCNGRYDQKPRNTRSCSTTRAFSERCLSTPIPGLRARDDRGSRRRKQASGFL